MGNHNKSRPPGGEQAGAVTVETAKIRGLNETIERALVKKGVLARALSVSPRCIELWVKQKKIPVVVLGKRCVRFDLPAVLQALRRFERKAVV